ncbi:MAG TPA: META domain-containing protein [Phycicoccus sp.]|nr:META domain-containing protein [Phycicoccus sp.]
MRRATVLVIVAVVTAVTVAGVLAARPPGGDTANGSVPVGSLAEVAGTWTAVNATGAPAELVAPVQVVVADGGLFVTTGCNTGRGPAHVEESRLVIDVLATTKRACPSPLDEQERWVLEMLGSRPRLERSGPMVALHWGEGERYWLGFELVQQPTSGTGTAPSV